MEKLTQETERIMTERFGKDTVIALATTEDGIPHVRYVNAIYGRMGRESIWDISENRRTGTLQKS